MNWDGAYFSGRDYSWFSTAALSELLETIGLMSGSTLDVGCGTGQLVRDLYHRGFKTVGVDTSKEAIEIAKKSTIFNDGVRFYVQDIAGQPLEEKFDLITCKYVIAFVPDRLMFVEGIVKMMKPEGSHFVVITPNPETVPDFKKNITVETEQLRSDLARHFSAVSVTVHGSDIWLVCRK